LKFAANEHLPIDYPSIIEKADPRILSLFPTLNILDAKHGQRARGTIFRRLACIYIIGKYGSISAADLLKTTNIPHSSLEATLKKLLSQSLLETARIKRRKKYGLTPKGIIVLTAFEKFWSFKSIKPLLLKSKNRNNNLAYALLVIGYSAINRPEIIFDTLTKYAEQGYNLEPLSCDAIAESLLEFYGDQCESEAQSPPQYINMFKEFTTAGFQDILRMLLTGMKPGPEAYNWLVQFFHELVEFYYNPVRMAYTNLLSDYPNLRSRLEQFKKEQERQTRTEGSKIELTFKVPWGSSELQKFMNMPHYLKTIGLRLVLEPLHFMTRELKDFFWPSKREWRDIEKA